MLGASSKFEGGPFLFAPGAERNAHCGKVIFLLS